MKLQLQHQQTQEEEQHLQVTLEPIKGQRMTLKNRAGRRKPKEFKDMTPAEKRVAIAKDVIKQLDAKRYEARQGTYFNSYIDDSVLELSDLKSNVVTPKYIKALDTGKVEACAVCAIGSSIVSGIRLSGRGKYTDYLGDPHRKVTRWFPGAQARLMEDCFEDSDYSLGRANRNAVDRFNDSLPQGGLDKDEARLRAVMANVIKNKGDFIP